jgi:hypothetical protein
MTFFDVVALVGALAWLPHLISLFRELVSIAKIRVITQQTTEIGFTTLGPIFNIRLAFAVTHKDIVISEIKLRLKHEQGDEKIFIWQGIVQHMGKMTLPNAVMPYEKESSVLAIKLNQKDIEERFVRFQDASFINAQREYLYKVDKKRAYLIAESKFEPKHFLREQEMVDLYNFNKHSFPWKIGKYKVIVEISSPEKFEVVDNELEFNLSGLEVEMLQKNIENLELDYKRRVSVPLEENEQFEWNWVNPSLVKYS